jgi:hypothetical protein
MKTNLKLLILFLLPLASLIPQNKTEDPTAEKYIPKLNRISVLHEAVKPVHPALEALYPVAIAEDGAYFIFEPDQNNKYRLVKKTSMNSPVPKGIRAAFPLAENGNKMTCVVTGEVFDSMDGYAIIFHEFIHCAEFYTIEPALKENLQIYKTAMARKDWMWELNYQFPYSKKEFSEAYASFLSALKENAPEKINESRKTLRQMLSPDEYSYMTWVEWKEGFARWAENKVRDKFKIEENHAGGAEPFDRVAFYEGGSRLIEFLFNSIPQIAGDPEKLYESIKK